MKRGIRPGYFSFSDTVHMVIHKNALHAMNMDLSMDPAVIAAADLVNDIATGLILRLDARGCILGIESGTGQAHFLYQQQLLGYSLEQLFPPSVAIIHMARLKKVLKTGKPAAYTYKLASTSGAVIQFEARMIRNLPHEVFFIIHDSMENRDGHLALVRGIIEGEEKERKRVAQELHDGLGQIISALYMQIGTLSKKQGMEEHLKGPMKMIADIISEYRAIAHNLMPPLLEGAGLPIVIKTLCDRVNTTGNVHASFRNIRFRSKPGKYILREMYRISQELIHNAVKHAECDIIDVTLDESNTDIIITINDNGKGFDVSEIKKQTRGIGLKNIFTRAGLIGGTVVFESVKNKGTTVIISIPKPFSKSRRPKKNAETGKYKYKH